MGTTAFDNLPKICSGDTRTTTASRLTHRPTDGRLGSIVSPVTLWW